MKMRRGGAVRMPTEKLIHMQDPRMHQRGGEPEPPEGCPEMPDDLSDDEKLVWQHAQEVITNMGLASKADAFALERYCRYFVLWRRLIAQGKAREAASCDTFMREFERSFGFTPSARASLTGVTKKEKTDDPKLRYFKG